MFIAALFIVTRNWAQPKCTSLYKWINNVWYVHTMEHYFTIKKNELLTQITWVNLKGTKLKETSPKFSHYIISFI